MDQSAVWVRVTGEGFVLARMGELFGHEAEVLPIESRIRKQMCSLDDIFPAGDPSKDVDDNCNFRMDQSAVWVRVTGEGFVLARMGELFGHEAEVLPIESRIRKQMCSLDDIFPAGDPSKDVDDNCELMFLNVATLLNNITLRYKKGKIYTYVANILLAVNPYRDIKNLYAETTIKSYQGKSLGEMPPHIFAIADKSFRDMKRLKQSQSIIISGESGAGKTESTKYILKYLCSNWANTAGPLEQKILDVNPILEAFGNAKTTRNNNSSRFGKFMEVHFDNQYQVVGGHISHYLLEKSRICVQSPEERNYHIFYLLCAGAPPELRKALRLTNPDNFLYLRNGCTQYFTSPASENKLNTEQKSKQQTARGGLHDPILDDVLAFQRLHQALAHICLSEAERTGMYSIVAAVLHLGNVQFEEDAEETRGGCSVRSDSELALSLAAQLLGVDPGELRMSLCSRLMQGTRRGLKGTAIMVPFKIHEAVRARDALAKAVYMHLFDLVMARVNTSIPFQASAYYIGVLDIAGFEYFTMNSFEQFCINYCNEKLQHFLNECVLENEQELYRREGLNVPEISFVNNHDCIDLFENKASGIFSLLDEKSKLPKPDFAYFTQSVHKQWSGKISRLQLPRTSCLKAHRMLRDDEGFLVRHFAGSVCYDTSQFIEKNNDALHASLECLVQESSSQLVQQLFTAPADGYATKGKLKFISVGSKFQTQLAQLMDKLKQNGSNFVRCIKPNSQMVSAGVESTLVLTQLQCSGTAAVLELMEHGYPSRAPFNDLYALYSAFLPPKLRTLQPKTFCEAVVQSFNLLQKDFKFGVTRVFFRPDKYSEFDAIMRSDPENLKAIVHAVTAWLVKSRWRKPIFGALTSVKLKNKMLHRRQCLITIQKHVRGYLVSKQHRPRYLGIMKIRILENNLKQMEQVVGQLEAKKADVQKEIDYLRTAIQVVCKMIKSDPEISSNVIDALCAQLQRQAETLMTSLHKSMADLKNRDEQERLRQIEVEMRAREEAKCLEEQRQREEEENRRLKSEMEARRKEEEVQRLKQEEADQVEALRIQQQLQLAEQHDKEERQRLEQERQDHEMAIRLAKETNGQVEGSPPQLRRSERVRIQQAMQVNQKYDLSKWKYSELRDTINTSCDIDLLEACRHEFHRRLKVYHAWKAKNQRKTTMGEAERAPKSIMDAAAQTPRMQQKGEILGARHRYFRIPFVRPSAASDDSVTPGGGVERRGWWYAHFDGQYVARQMELHPDKTPVLLQSGLDDMQMCELSLEETGLTRKRGAEILQHEFEREWARNGGPTYVSKS